jgi:hypothetical protein
MRAQLPNAAMIEPKYTSGCTSGNTVWFAFHPGETSLRVTYALSMRTHEPTIRHHWQASLAFQLDAQFGDVVVDVLG